MKFLNCLFAVLFVPALANAEVLLERDLFNARNGESYTCKIHADANSFKTELINEGISIGKFDTEFTASPDNVKKWVTELKARAGNATTFSSVLESKPISKYAHRGYKSYSVYKNGKKMNYYLLRQHVFKSKSRGKNQKQKLGSIEYKVSKDNSNVQRLRGQTDEACKRATAKL